MERLSAGKRLRASPVRSRLPFPAILHERQILKIAGFRFAWHHAAHETSVRSTGSSRQKTDHDRPEQPFGTL
jgi:hypothetical protein